MGFVYVQRLCFATVHHWDDTVLLWSERTIYLNQAVLTEREGVREKEREKSSHGSLPSTNTVPPPFMLPLPPSLLPLPLPFLHYLLSLSSLHLHTSPFPFSLYIVYTTIFVYPSHTIPYLLPSHLSLLVHLHPFPPTTVLPSAPFHFLLFYPPPRLGSSTQTHPLHPSLATYSIQWPLPIHLSTRHSPFIYSSTPHHHGVNIEGNANLQ